MIEVRRTLCWVLVFAILSTETGCATGSRVSATTTPPSSKREALEREASEAARIQNDKKESADQIDQWLRVASMAMDANEPAYAREILIDVTQNFTALLSDKEFVGREGQALRTVGGKEEEKYFLGDPYEQMMSFLYLGILDFQAGDYSNARVSFRNASLADKGSSVEGYDSDCSLALLLEGVSSLRIGLVAEAEDAFRFAERAFAFRQNMPVAQVALYQAAGSLQPDDGNREALARLDAAMPVIFERLPAVLSVNFDVPSAIRESVGVAIIGLDRPEKKSAADRFLDACDNKKSIAIDLLNQIQQRAVESISPEILAPAEKAKAQFAHLVETCRDPRTNTFILQQFGWAPAKIRTGRYGQVLQFHVYPVLEQRTVNTLRRTDGGGGSQLAFLSMPGESINYQAMTRGGRQMDSILEGRAQFRDSMNVVSGLAMTAVPIALYAGALAATTLVTTTTTTVTYTFSSTGAVTATTTTTTSTAPAGAAAAGPFIIAAVAALAVYKGTKMIADATHPEGDIRGWHELPSHILFMCGSLEPGSYELTTDLFDSLAQPLVDRQQRVAFVVAPDRPCMVLANSIWR